MSFIVYVTTKTVPIKMGYYRNRSLTLTFYVITIRNCLKAPGFYYEVSVEHCGARQCVGGPIAMWRFFHSEVSAAIPLPLSASLKERQNGAGHNRRTWWH